MYWNGSMSIEFANPNTYRYTNTIGHCHADTNANAKYECYIYSNTYYKFNIYTNPFGIDNTIGYCFTIAKFIIFSSGLY